MTQNSAHTTDKPESRQFNFFCLPEEVNVLLPTLLSNNAEIVGLPLRTSDVAVLPQFPSVDEGFWFLVLLCPSSLLPSVRTHYVEAQKYHLVDQLRSPIVEFSMPFKDEKSLRRSRFYMHAGYWEHEKWIEHPDAVKLLYDRLVLKIKSILTKERRFGDLISNGALEAEKSGVELRQM
jgi:hypothetical protein